MRKITLYHGSNHIIKTPIYGEGKEYNDYGKGFYCTQHIELAKEWACTQNTDGYVNKYEIDTTGLSILKLSSDEYSILHWLALLVNYRKFRISTPLMKLGVDWLLKHFLIDISKYDIIIGYRADDSYFSFAKAFLNNEISEMKTPEIVGSSKIHKDAYTKWNVYIGRKKERPQRAEKMEN